MTWFAVACELHRDWRNDVEGLAALFSSHIPDYRNPINSHASFKAGKQRSSSPPQRAGSTKSWGAGGHHPAPAGYPRLRGEDPAGPPRQCR